MRILSSGVLIGAGAGAVAGEVAGVGAGAGSKTRKCCVDAGIAPCVCDPDDNQ